MSKSIPREFHKRPHNTVLSQCLSDGEHEIGGGHACAQLSLQMTSHHLWQCHRQGQSQHRRLCLNAAHAPAQNAQTIHHRGMAIRAQHTVGIKPLLAAFVTHHHQLCQVLQIHLMTNTTARGNQTHIGKGLLSPFQKAIPLAVAFKFSLLIDFLCLVRGKSIHTDRMIHHHIQRNDRIDATRLSS